MRKTTLQFAGLMMLAASAVPAMACDERPAASARGDVLSQAQRQLRHEARVALADDARAALVALRSQTASALAAGPGFDESPASRAAP